MLWWQIFKDLFANKSLEQAQGPVQEVTTLDAGCGHHTNTMGTIQVQGLSVQVKLEPQKGLPAYCLDCLAGMAIRCAWCGESILPSDPITLYRLADKAAEVPDYAIRFEGSYVGCLRWNCAESGVDRAGFWVAPGRVEQVASPLEISLGLNMLVANNDLLCPEEASALYFLDSTNHRPF